MISLRLAFLLSDIGQPLSSAVAGHFECVGLAAFSFPNRIGSTDRIADRAIERCARFRAIALSRGAVPNRFATMAEYDAVVRSIAVQSVNDARGVSL